MLLSARHTVPFVQILTEVVPDLANLFPDTRGGTIKHFLESKMDHENWKLANDTDQLFSERASGQDIVLIRKNDFRLSRFEARSKGQERVFTNANDDYLDPLDREVLCTKQKKQNKSF